jgi:ketosteroid isomerase-like protein
MNTREVVEKVLRVGQATDIDGLVELMAPDGCIEWPFRPPGVPGRLQGREEIRAFLTEAALGFVRFSEFRNVVVHESVDPEVVIVEYDAIGTVLDTGAPFSQTVIAVFRVRDDLVLSYRDYINPLPLAEALAGRAGAAERS